MELTSPRTLGCCCGGHTAPGPEYCCLAVARASLAAGQDRGTRARAGLPHGHAHIRSQLHGGRPAGCPRHLPTTPSLAPPPLPASPSATSAIASSSSWLRCSSAASAAAHRHAAPSAPASPTVTASYEAAAAAWPLALPPVLAAAGRAMPRCTDCGSGRRGRGTEWRWEGPAETGVAVSCDVSVRSVGGGPARAGTCSADEQAHPTRASPQHIIYNACMCVPCTKPCSRGRPHLRGLQWRPAGHPEPGLGVKDGMHGEPDARQHQPLGLNQPRPAGAARAVAAPAVHRQQQHLIPPLHQHRDQPPVQTPSRRPPLTGRRRVMRGWLRGQVGSVATPCGVVAASARAAGRKGCAGSEWADDTWLLVTRPQGRPRGRREENVLSSC